MVNPNPFTPTERDSLRTYFGFPKIWSNSNPIYEGVLNAIDGLYDDPSDLGATQAAVRSVLTQLLALDVQIQNNMNLMLATDVSQKVKFDAIRQDCYWRSVMGPALIRQLANRMSIDPATDYYSPANINPGSDIYMHRLRGL